MKAKKAATRAKRSAPAKQKEEDDIFLRLQRLPKAARVVYSRPRLFISIAIGLASLLVMPWSWRLTTRLLLAWDVSLVLYLSLAFTTVFSCGAEFMRRQAALQDDGRFFILGMTSTAALASIIAIVLELGAANRGQMQLLLAVVTIALSWAAIHTTFALHYAHEYYRGETGGLAFPGGGDPDYWDFVYFSFVVGMTAQVSDVGITDKIIRRTAAAHGVVSFVFNTALLALMVNIAASAI
ncbi:MAG: DUF1345 domain-containing protein [Bradyrhizobiaceae bacterium]|nr:MAG: DUF1345 domain-containing protein [Bradyrhizobiaceae bacterium]